MMRRLVFSIIFCGAICSASAQCPEPGTSAAVWGNHFTASNLEQACSEGIRWMEVTMNTCYRGVPMEQISPRIDAMKKTIDSTDMKVWSVHLPFSRTLDISVSNDSLRRENVAFMAKMIRRSAIFSPQRLVLHPSSEPIADEERERRIACAIESIRELKPAADAAGVMLCIENLPRTCLGNTPEELVRIVDAVPGVYICFDTNHYVKGTTTHFIETAGERIRTVHMSDFDFENECHWLPFEGDVEWAAFLRDMTEKAHYDGVWMHEVKRIRRNGNETTTADIAAGYARMYNEYQTETTK